MARNSQESQHENKPRAAELRNGAVHAMQVGELHGKSEHLTGPEHFRQTEEHAAQSHARTAAPTVGHGVTAFGHKEIAELAYRFWQARGCPEGSGDEDWFRAAEELRSRAYALPAEASS
jgi:hypothetical protein